MAIINNNVKNIQFLRNQTIYEISAQVTQRARFKTTSTHFARPE